MNSEVDNLDTNVLEVLQEMLAVISAKFRSALAQLLVLHPGLMFRCAFAFGRATTDEAASVWHDSVSWWIWVVKKRWGFFFYGFGIPWDLSP